MLAAWWTSHLELDWQNDELRNFVEDLARNHTVVRYDRPGVGMSDRGDRPYDLETEVGHLQSVIERRGGRARSTCSGSPVVVRPVWSWRPGDPELVRRLVFFGSYARRPTDHPTPDPGGASVPSSRRTGVWGAGRWRGLPPRLRLADRPPLLPRSAPHRQRRGGGRPAAADLRHGRVGIHRSVGQPTLVLHRRHDQVIEAHLGRDLAERLPEAEFRELEGSAHQPWGEQQGDVVAAIEEFLTDGTATTPVTRHLATVVFLDIVDSTAQMSGLGDQPWRSRLDALHGLIEREAAPRGGTVVKDTGDGAMLSFALPGDALGFATTIRGRASSLDLTLRVGVHAGEVEMRGDDITGRTVVIASRLCDLAPPGRVYLSATTSDLAAGRGAAVREVGSHELKGIPEPVMVVEADPDAAVGDGAADGGSIPTFERSGSVWTISFDGSEVTVPHSKGVADLATAVRLARHRRRRRDADGRAGCAAALDERRDPRPRRHRGVPQTPGRDRGRARRGRPRRGCRSVTAPRRRTRPR